MLGHYDEHDRLKPSHNEPWVEKQLLKDAHETVVDIAKGRSRYLKGTDIDTPIRKLDISRFSVVTRADQTEP